MTTGPEPFMKKALLWFCLALFGAVCLAALAPMEKTLGANARLVYFHGAWVWASLAGFGVAALTGAAGLVFNRLSLHQWSRGWGRSALFFWITFLPMSLVVMQANWNGLFLDEPRFRTPLDLAVTGLLLQMGLSLLKDIRWTSLFNVLYLAVLGVVMSSTESILHPDSPIFNANSAANDRSIQLYFIGLIILLLLAAWQMARAWKLWQEPRAAPPPQPRATGTAR